MSDGDGDPANAFSSMRGAGLDVAALTDHSGVFTIGGLSSAEWKRTSAPWAGGPDHRPGPPAHVRGGYTQLSSHIRFRHASSGIGVPV